MKTQISNLINGAKNVKRDLENPKYIGAPKSTSFGDYAGTNSETRRLVAEKVLAENQTEIMVKIGSITFCLPKCSSTTGKTTWYEISITEAEFMQIAGYSAKPFDHYLGSYSLKIYGDMTVCLNKWARPSDRHQWKFRGYDWIGEEFVTILN